MRASALMLPARWRLRLWLVLQNARGARAPLARRLVQVPRAEIATRYGARRVRRRRAAGPVGVERLASILVINLDSRRDRLDAFMAQAARLELPRVSRFQAIADPSDPRSGSRRSHTACVERLLSEGHEAVMVCEDDLRFLVGRAELDVVVEAFLRDPSAELLNIAYTTHRPTVPYSALFRRSFGSLSAACYVAKASIARELVRVWKEPADPSLGTDRRWQPLHETHTFLVPAKRIAIQAPGYSDIESKETVFQYEV
jgi:hypothetical protein